MNILREPRVYLVGRQTVDRAGLERFLGDTGATWSTDTDVAAEQLCEAAGRLCYLSFGKGRKDNAEYLANLIAAAHGSVLEHAVWNFIIAGVSRSFTHELVRHRAGFAYSQLSQRYVDESAADFVEPDCIADDPELHTIWAEAIRQSHGAYVRLVEGLQRTFASEPDATLRRKLARQAARSVLPNATETRIFVTANARAWRHFIEARAHEQAEIEIRKVAIQILRILQKEAPSLFRDYDIVRLADGTEVARTAHRKVEPLVEKGERASSESPMEGSVRKACGAAVVALGMLAGLAPVRADTCDVYLKSGLKLRGDIVATDSDIVLRNAAGEVRLARPDIERIVPVESPATPASQSASQPEPTTQPAEAPPDHGVVELGKPAEPRELPPAPPISKDDIQRLRMHELFLDDPPEPVRVQFERKGRQRDLAVEVLDELKKRPDFQPRWEEVLTHSLPHEKVQLILRETGLKYADRMKILSDPEVFATFRRRVLPLVDKSCGRAGCHAGTAAHVFRFPVGSKTSETYAYTCFVLLDQMQTRAGDMINRSDPQHSALLNYMLPPDEIQHGHPPLKRGAAFKAVIWGHDDPQYAALVEWIRSLTVPHPDYGLEYQNPYPGSAEAALPEPKEGPEPTAREPASQPAGAEPGERP